MPDVEITKDSIIGDVLDAAPNLAPVFMEAGMHCVFCPSARSETIEEACCVHGLDCDTLLSEVEAHLALQE